MREQEHLKNDIPTELPPKRARLSPTALTLGPISGHEVASPLRASNSSFIKHWAEEDTWPEDFYKADGQVYGMNPLLTIRRPTSLRRKRSDISFSSSTNPSEQQSEGGKSAPYKNANYAQLLKTQGNSYMGNYELGIADTNESLCQKILEQEQPVPKDTLFRDEKTFEITCGRLQDRNEALIFRDLTPLIAPFAALFATFGAKHLTGVIETVNEGWENCIPVTKPRPQPDYAVGFGPDAFSEDQLSKLQPFVGDPAYLSYFMATFTMYFPFLTCEVKSGNTGLDIADRQNAHSMTVAMRGVVELFRFVGREREIHREILGFSISHDPQSVRIWGHYPVIDKDKTTFWRYPVRSFVFTERKGKERWTSYIITKNIYDFWVPSHFERLSSAINDIPPKQALQSSVPPDLQPAETSGIWRDFQNQALEQEPENQDRMQPVTPETSTRTETPAAEKKKS